jgi:hypothetical protein
LNRTSCRPAPHPPTPHRPAPSLRGHIVVVIALAALVATPAALAGEGRQQPELLSRDYPTRHLSRIAAEALLWEACPDDPDAYCVVEDSDDPSYARLVASPAVQRRAVALLAEQDTPAGAYTLRIDLLTFERDGVDRLDGLAPAARQAVDRLRPELGGSGYVLADSGLVRTSDGGRTALLVDGNVYNIYLDLRRAHHGERLLVDGIELHASRTTGNGGSSELPTPAGSVLSAALDLGVGETAVVGMTRLDASRDLVMLVTATR